MEPRAIKTGGALPKVVIYRAISFAIIFPILAVLQGFAALGWLCLGLAAVRSGPFEWVLRRITQHGISPR